MNWVGRIKVLANRSPGTVSGRRNNDVDGGEGDNCSWNEHPNSGGRGVCPTEGLGEESSISCCPHVRWYAVCEYHVLGRKTGA